MRAVRLETANIHNTAQLRTALDQALAYSNWYDGANDDWMDLIGYFDSRNPNNNKSWYNNGEFYLIEVVAAQQFMAQEGQLSDQLIKWVAKTNQQYIKRVGKPLIALVPLP